MLSALLCQEQISVLGQKGSSETSSPDWSIDINSHVIISHMTHLRGKEKAKTGPMKIVIHYGPIRDAKPLG